ncbi:uncharacterized protein BDR25DRAFT_335907 [Lindgomyces ingoldianus]|uniref:Uncharacterized protein n=1 Tax=Lindgomyces ingoldianus TaxID=673940 RepID=A0ACB6QMV5_9PLEO|nr:uncharacterized protein BDR25DRAFT_335907 [Lindgomyces ingoldianus]KAF2467481.1 hypothetical protein BDR25DRAFT_335907 [Lindgomyces ingoldianus]
MAANNPNNPNTISLEPDAGPTQISPLEPDTAIEDGPLIDDGDSAISSLATSTTSIRDELILQLKEHGRQYQGYMEATDAHPESEVIGVDLAPVQPENVPPNLNFEVDDLEKDWTFSRKFNYIHCQLMTGAFRDWPRFFMQSFQYLENDGYLEVHDIDFVIKCDDGTLPTNSALVRWHNYMHDAAQKAAFPLDAISHVPEMMKTAGFVDVVATPIKWPINAWPKDPKYKELGRGHYETRD